MISSQKFLDKNKGLWRKEKSISVFGYTDNACYEDKLISGFDLFMAFFVSKKNLQHSLPYALN